MAETDYPIDQLTPADEDPVSAAEELADVEDALGADATSPDDLTVTTEEPPPLGRAWAFDFIEPGFVRGLSAAPLETRGIETLRTWIEKCLRTERGAYAIHPPEYGLENAYSGIGQAQDAPELADLEDRIADALTFHPRITSVENFDSTYDPDDDYLAVAFDVVLDDDTRLAISTEI